MKRFFIIALAIIFGAFGTAWINGSAKAEESNKLQSQKTSRQRLRDGSNCTTEDGLNNRLNAPGDANTGNENRYRGGNGNGNGNGNKSGGNSSNGKGSKGKGSGKAKSQNN